MRRLGEHDRWSPDGWERLRGLPWAHDAERPVRPGESLIEDGRLVVPPSSTGPRAAPAIQRRIYIRREEVFKYGATAGCPACDCVLDERRITVPHSDACRARITEAMSKDESGQARLDAYADKRRERREAEKIKPRVVDIGEKDVSAEDATGSPEKKARVAEATEESEETEDTVVYDEDPKKRAAMKQAAAPVEAPKANPKTAPGPTKRPGELRIESKAKPKPSPVTGEKRAAEIPAEELDPRAVGSSVRDMRDMLPEGVPETPPVEYVPPKPPSELRSLVKQAAYENIRASVQAMFTGHGLEASEQEIADIASLSCDMAAVDIAEVYSPQRFTAEAERFKLRPGFAIDLCEQKPDGGHRDMTKPDDVKLAWELLKRDEPLLLTGSPPCHHV